MQNLNRDLLVITKRNVLNQQELENTILALNPILFTVENFSAICGATEVFDLNSYTTHKKFKKVAKYIRFSPNKAYVFFANKN
jgi:hypothetical protein